MRQSKAAARSIVDAARNNRQGTAIWIANFINWSI